LIDFFLNAGDHRQSLIRSETQPDSRASAHIGPGICAAASVLGVTELVANVSLRHAKCPLAYRSRRSLGLPYDLAAICQQSGAHDAKQAQTRAAEPTFAGSFAHLAPLPPLSPAPLRSIQIIGFRQGILP
jgi:hypothetical protein